MAGTTCRIRPGVVGAGLLRATLLEGPPTPGFGALMAGLALAMALGIVGTLVGVFLAAGVILTDPLRGGSVACVGLEPCGAVGNCGKGCGR